MNQGNLNESQNNGINNPQITGNSINVNNNVNSNAQQIQQLTPNNPTSSVIPNTTNVMQTQPIQPVENNNSVVAPTQTIINTGNKKTISVVWFLLVILMALFIYFIDDILAYFNQNFTPVVKEDVSENSSANLIDGFIKIDITNSYIRLKSIRFNNVKKGDNNTIFISYVSDKNYSASLPLGIVIELYNQNKEKIYEEDFNVFGSIESDKTRQYKLSLKETIYNEAYYCLIKTK